MTSLSIQVMFKRCTLNCTRVPSPSPPRDDDSFRAPLCHSESVVHPVSLPPKTYRVLLRGGTAYNENNVPGELVIPQYRIMYNYIAGRKGSER